MIDGYLDMQDAIIISISSLGGAILGLFLYNRDSKKGFKKSKDKINKILTGILISSIILMPFLINYEVNHNSKAYDFGDLC